MKEGLDMNNEIKRKLEEEQEEIKNLWRSL
jgi:hypothetical protein